MRNNQIKAIAIILVAVIALSVGFAAFSATLNIESQANVNPNASDFSVKFSKQENILDESNVIATNVVGDSVEAMDAKIDNSSAPTITDLNVSFTKPGESVTYEFYVMNTGEYKAYLRDVEFKRSVNGVDFISCKAGTGTTDELVEQACEGINFELTIDGQAYIENGTFVVQELAKGASKKVTVKISYETGSALADGPFTVNIGDVALTYASTSAGEYPDPTIPEELDSSCFISVIPGEINKYVCDDTNIIIPNNLTLPVSTIDKSNLRFNSTKCSYAEDLIKQVDQNLTCAGAESLISSMPVEQIFGSMFGVFVDIVDLNQIQTNGENEITTIGTGVFAINNLTSAYIPSSIKVVKDYAFTASGISELILNQGLEEIGEQGFGLNNLTSINLPNSLVIIGPGAFDENQLSGELIIPNSVTTIGDNAFDGQSNVSSNQISKLIFENGSNLQIIGNQVFYGNQISGELIIPNSVVKIGDWAFMNNRLTSVTLGDNVTTIGENVFKENFLTTVYINALKSNISFTDEDFGWDKSSNCASWTGDHKDNPCITWVNG